MNSTKAAPFIDDTEAHPPEGPVDALDAVVGILVGVLAGSATWLAIGAVILVLNQP